MENPKIIFDWMKSRSASSRRAWERRWEQGSAPIGPKGEAYMKRESDSEADYYDYEGPVWEDDYEWSY